MDRFEYSASKLEPGERSVYRLISVKLYDGDIKTKFEGGELVLTTHRLLWGHPGDLPRGLTCLSLPLQCVIFIEEEQNTSFFSKSRRIILHLAEPVKGKNLGPVAYSPNNFIKLSIKEDCSNLIKTLNEVTAAKAWSSHQTSGAQPKSNHSVTSGIKLRTGIVGIERGIQEKQKATDDNISAAFQDLSKLMIMANDMVHISKAISAKIREKQGDITEDETVRFKSYLLSLGIDDPVTRDSFNSQNEFYQNLAKQISEMMLQPIIEVGGMMSLTDVYCRVNRARGLELLSPEDLLAACRLLAHLNLPIQLRQFDSGVKVLQLEAHTDKAIVTATAQLVKEKDSINAEQLAQELGISVILAKERLLTTEQHGFVCRDESIEGLRFFPNLFLDK